MSKRWLLLLMFFAAVLFAACDDDDSTTTPEDTTDTTDAVDTPEDNVDPDVPEDVPEDEVDPEGCESNTDCAEDANGPICDTDTGNCVECMDDAQCETGFSCDMDSYTCVEDVVEGCESNDDCTEGVCDTDANECVECLSAMDCDEGYLCNADNECEMEPTDCTVDGCTEGVCDTTTGACVDCLQDSDCDAGEICNNSNTCEQDNPGDCDTNGFTPVFAAANYDAEDDVVFYNGYSDTAYPVDILLITVPGATTASTITLGTGDNADPNTCTECVYVYTGYDGQYITGAYFARSGELDITAISTTEGENFAATLNNVELIALDDQGAIDPAGQTWCVNNYSFDYILGGGQACSANSDCPAETPICDTTAGECVGCIADSDCASGEVCTDGACAVDGWTCDASWYGDGSCDCGCGILDVDCADGTDASCEYCDACNPTTDCASVIDDDENWLCQGACTSDADCSGDTPICNDTSGVCVACLDDSNCSAPTAFCDASNECVACLQDSDCGVDETCSNGTCMGAVPTEWVCSESWWSDSDCDCGCGVLDPACAGDTANTACDYCIECGGSPCEDNVETNENWLCMGACTSNADCTAPTGVCDAGTCVECVVDGDCAAGSCMSNICVDTSTCTQSNFTSVDEAFTFDAAYDFMNYEAHSAATAVHDLLNVGFAFGGTNNVTGPGTYPLGTGDNSNFATASELVYLITDFEEGVGYDKLFFAATGNLVITEVSNINGSNFVATLEDVVLIEVEIDGSYNSTPVAGGETWCLPSYPINITLEDGLCAANSDCAAPTGVCDTASGACVECMVDGDCAAGTCIGNTCIDPSSCDFNDFTQTSEEVQYSASQEAFVYAGANANTDEINLELFYNFGGNASPVTGPGSYPLGQGINDNYSTCVDCLLIRAADTKVYYAIDGTLNVTDYGTNDGDTFSGTMENVVLIEVEIESGTYVSTPVVGGATWCFSSVPFTASVTNV